MRYKLLITVLVVVVALGIQLVSYLLLVDPVSDVIVLDYDFVISNTPGFDASTDKLRLGSVTPGGRAWRDVTIFSNKTQRVSVLIKGSGSDYLFANYTSVLLPGENNITFIVSPPIDAKMGRYSGKVYIRTYE